MTKTKNEEDLLGIPQLVLDLGIGGNNSLALTTLDKASTADRRRIQKEIDLHEAGIDAVLLKALKAKANMGEMTRAVGSEYAYTLEYLDRIDQEAEGTDYEEKLKRVNHVLGNILAQHGMALVKVGGEAMARIVVMDPFPQEPEEPKRFLGIF